MKETLLFRSTVWLLFVAILLLPRSPAAARETRGHAPLAGNRLAEIYRSAAPAVVGIECRDATVSESHRYFGTGAIIDPGGLVLTSITVVPEKATNIRVFLRGGRTLPGSLLEAVPEKEFCLLRIDHEGEFPYLRLGDSTEVRVGQLGLTLGNAFHSIKTDDQVALAAGLVSGRYTLTNARPQAKYVGPIFETTAAVNDGMDGGPLVNSRGEIIGLLSLNFSTHRWLGTAIPINLLKPLLAQHQPWFSDRDQPTGSYIGIEVFESSAGARSTARRSLQIARVYRGGPAATAGLEQGQVLLALNGEPLPSLAALREHLEKAPPGARLRFRVLSLAEGETQTVTSKGEIQEVTVSLWRRF